LIVALHGGLISASSTFATIQFKDRAACVAAADYFENGSKGPIGYVCISAETGEVYKASRR
jgi:hypothetical protein